MVSLLSYESRCEKYVIGMQEQDKVTKDWNMEQINSQTSPIIFQ